MRGVVRQKYHTYPPAAKAHLKRSGVPPDSRSNGPAVCAFKLAGGERPQRSGTNREWSVHHIYDGKFPAPGRGETTHAVRGPRYFTHSAGLVAVHPIADALADEVPYFAWLLKAGPDSAHTVVWLWRKRRATAEFPADERSGAHKEMATSAACFKCSIQEMIGGATALILLFVSMSAGAAAGAQEELLRARSLKCTFGPGTVADWEKGSPRMESDKFGKPLNYDAIDLKNGRARVISSSGATDLTVTAGPYGLTFTENFIAGISITTVFSKYKKGTREFIAVLSRHVAVLGPPLPSQYHGTCSVLHCNRTGRLRNRLFQCSRRALGRSRPALQSGRQRSRDPRTGGRCRAL